MITIPEKYAANLFARFNYDNATEVYNKKKLIDVPCGMCLDYHHTNYIERPHNDNRCIKCPFDKYKIPNLRGCSALIEDIYPHYWTFIEILITSISWYVKDDEDAKVILDRITKALQEEISWI